MIGQVSCDTDNINWMCYVIQVVYSKYLIKPKKYSFVQRWVLKLFLSSIQQSKNI